jgi:hypothetical protein
MAFTQPLQGAAETKPEAQKARPRTTNEWALGLVLVIFGAIGWIAGSKYTLFGWVDGLNLLLSWLGLPFNVPTPAGYFILIAIPLGIMYSRVETRIWHRRSEALMRTPLFWLGWLIIVLSDVATTFLGVRIISADSWQISQQIAGSLPIAAIIAGVLTFAPEWAILGGMRFLRR